jgi:hypothetical protein
VSGEEFLGVVCVAALAISMGLLFGATLGVAF